MNNAVLKGEKHLTSSVILLTDSTPVKVLLIHHKKLDTWFQPGGHVEYNENPIEAAVREVKEETGVDISFLLQKIEVIDETGKFLPIPSFFMEQLIPARKDQPEHFHLDVMYTVKVKEQEFKESKHEVKDIGWFTLDEALALDIYKNTEVMLKRVFNPSP